MDKEQLRASLQKCLLEMSEEQRIKKSQKACKNLISTSQYQKASIIMMYLSLPHEVDTSEAVLHSWQLGKTVVMPKVSWQQRHMIPVRITSLETDFAEQVVDTVPVIEHDEPVDFLVTDKEVLYFNPDGRHRGQGE